ncbi:efflux RND transporter periplasmic adaptor subunit [Siccirubricoccus sp. KC 17139]|uniref:Efflux RND transporter periplasmic adaptor subunit n=1 Tax=Siccirubricoccus soli TaxID=2899147 RepID=A0ABT1D2H8_9PROT|nr:efflux RND transporter periplasmic adaptor subunit [Siccirubricoccus soli]MCO6416118.1 efflux RND transporter periplasmic adaptor subunit [Siccirubricoccus soli]MCP2682252.1 efflux RND transporter periplasmic adaptor subunit [Siccirubricoccus soli]
MKSVLAFLAGGVVALGVTVVAPGLPATLRSSLGLAPPVQVVTPAGAADPAGGKGRGGGHAHGAGGDHGEEAPEGTVRMTEEQVAAARIEVAEAGPGTVARRISLPGTVAANADRLAHVPARVAGIVTALNRRLGDTVAAGEVLAVVESAEIATAKGEYLAALRTTELARVTFEREQRLWQRKVSAEQDFLKARTDWQEAQIRLDLTRQKLAAIGLSQAEIEALPRQPIEALRRQEVRAPIAGRITARPKMLGEAVSAEAELYTLADLSTVWVEMAVPTADLAFVKEGMAVRIRDEGEVRGAGRIVFLAPVLDPETRSARAVVEAPNPEGALRPGGFVTAEVATEEQRADVLVPRAAVQEIGGESVVFVRTPEGFEKREVVLGRGDREAVEVVFGLEPGERYAAANTFVLKAELGKSEAEHSH